MTFVSTLGQALDQIERFKVMQENLSTLQTQIATGKKTQVFSGLGTDLIFSKRARADFKSLDSFINNMAIADRRIKIMTNGIEEFQQQTRNIVGAMELQTQTGEYDIQSIGDLADNVFDFLVDILNEQDGDRYVFGGTETLTPPINNTGTIDGYVTTQVNQWINATIDNTQLIASYRDRTALTDTIAGYSPALSSGNAKNVFVRVEERTELDYTVLANNQGFRDVLAGVSMLKKFSDVLDEVTLEANDPVGTVTAPGATQQEQNDNFYAVFNDIIAMLNGALDQLDTERFNMSQVQAQMSQITQNHELEKNTLLATISDVEDVDINEAAVKLNALQIQLEASFRVSSSIRDLTLVNFI